MKKRFQNASASDLTSQLKTLAWCVGWCWMSLADFHLSPAAAQQPDLASSPHQLFRSQVAPLLVKKCLNCHGGTTTEGGYSLSSLEWMTRPGDSGESPVVFGQPESSELWRRLVSSDEDVRMPVDSPALETAELEAVRQWLQLGTSITEKLTQQDREKQLVEWVESSHSRATPEHYPRALPVNALALSQDGKQVLVAGYGEVTIWETATGQLLRRLPVGGRHISQLQLTTDGTQLMVASGTPGELGLVELCQLTPIPPASAPADHLRIATLSDVPTAACLSPTGKQIAIGGMDGVLRIARLAGSKVEIDEFASHADAILDVAWSSDGSRLLTASRDRTAKLFDTTSWELLISYARHERAVGGAGFVGKHPLTLDETGTLRLMDGDNLENDRALAEKSGLPRRIQSFRVLGSTAIVPDEGQLRGLKVTYEEVADGKTADGKPKTKKAVRWVEKPTEPLAGAGRIQSLSVVDDLLAIGTDRGQVALWQLDRPQPPAWFVASP
jgi:hypothetical protein